MRRNTIGFIWLGGLAFALILDLIGPDRFIAVASSSLYAAIDQFSEILRLISMAGFDMIRSAAIAIFIVFLILGYLAAQRGFRARGAMIVISILFLLLAESAGHRANASWFAALILVTVGALAMTRRLTRGPGFSGV